MIIKVNLEGLDTLAGNMNRFLMQERKAAESAMTKMILDVRRDAVKKAPVVTGHLRKSAFAVSPRGNVIAGARPNFQNIRRGAYSHSRTVSNAINFFHRPDMENYPLRIRRRRGANRFRLAIGRGAEIRGKTVDAYVGFSMYYGMKVHENPNTGKNGNLNKRGKPRRYSRVGGPYFLKKASFGNQVNLFNNFSDIMVNKLSKVKYKKFKSRRKK